MKTLFDSLREHDAFKRHDYNDPARQLELGSVYGPDCFLVEGVSGVPTSEQVFDWLIDCTRKHLAESKVSAAVSAEIGPLTHAPTHYKTIPATHPNTHAPQTPPPTHPQTPTL